MNQCPYSTDKRGGVMRTKITRCLLILSFGALLSSGCAKKDMVKSEEPVSSAQTTPPPAVVTPPVQGARPETQTQQAPMTEAPTREFPVTQETAKPAEPAEDLQSALQKIYFNFDSADLSEESRKALSKNAEYLSKQTSVKIRIEGNCDERGSDDYNMALGERRAKAAKDYLVNLGIPSGRLGTISYGEEKPADPGHDEAAWAKNRRDEFVIVK